MLMHPAVHHQRAFGRAEVALSRRDGLVRLERLYQAGCAKALMPRSHRPVPEVVLVNTAGGVTGGDRIDWRIDLGAATALVATTQVAERVYRSAGGSARIVTRIALGPGARLDWLPQETIVFEAGALRRSLEIDMVADARLLALEFVVLGRTAMGESVATGMVCDQWRIRHEGRLVHAEALRASGNVARAVGGCATLAGGRALATLVEAAPGAEAQIGIARALLDSVDGVEAAATAKPGVLVVRFLAADPAALRNGLIRFLTAFRSAPLPRVWTM